jgi:3-phenylpropionate/trans-cinnamate dioxygenase ferredoxin subunit
MSDYVKACAVADVPDEGAVRVIVGGVPLAIVRSDGNVYAIFDVCSHQDVPLSEGDVEEGSIECWLHGSRFDLRTGKPTGLPATEPVATFPVEVRGTEVYVDVTTTLNGVTPQ